MNAPWPGPSHPQGPAGPGPSGPATPHGPQPSGPPPGNPKTADEQLLTDIDSALIGLLALAYFSPTVCNTSASVRQVCAAEVLLHRLRMARRAVRGGPEPGVVAGLAESRRRAR
jgi:hypothetical protein